MNEEIKVGDICTIVSPASADLVGCECEVVGEEKIYERKIQSSESFEVWVWCRGFMVILARDGHRYCIEKICLRKKRPPAAPEQLLRQDTIPRADFERWLERVREQKPVEEPA